MKSARELVEAARRDVHSVDVDAARALLRRDDVLFVDLREDFERRAEGVIPGACHVPRGLLEFQVDPASPWHRPELASRPRLLLFCAAGWRSALAAKALQEMGLAEVSHLGEGFTAWKAAGAPVAPLAEED